MGGCCSGASKTSEENLPVSQDYGYVPAHQATVSPLSTGLLVDVNLDTTVPDTYRPPPAPIPYEAYVGKPPSSSANKEELKDKNESQNTNTEPLEKPESHGKVEKIAELEELSGIEDENFDDDLKKSKESYFPPVPVEDDMCPICLEEYDEENPKMITQCDHHYHLACILEWMERSDSCPVCDQAVVLSPALEG